MTSVITTNKQIIIVLLSMFSLFLFPNNASGKDLGVKKAYFEKIIKKATIILNSKKISADDGLPVYLYIDLYGNQFVIKAGSNGYLTLGTIAIPAGNFNDTSALIAYTFVLACSNLWTVDEISDWLLEIVSKTLKTERQNYKDENGLLVSASIGRNFTDDENALLITVERSSGLSAKEEKAEAAREEKERLVYEKGRLAQEKKDAAARLAYEKNRLAQEKKDAAARDKSKKLCQTTGFSGAECNFCGDGTVDLNEECDDKNYDENKCTKTCKNNVCGDGLVNPDIEQCDDGNSSNLDYCDTFCHNTFCGDGVIQAVNGNIKNETCDDGNSIDSDGCDHDCTVTMCGNGIISSNEQCDDGNSSNLDYCDTFCKNTFCGDGVIQPTNGNNKRETCDDGNSIDSDGCSESCLTESYSTNMVPYDSEPKEPISQGPHLVRWVVLAGIGITVLVGGVILAGSPGGGSPNLPPTDFGNFRLP